MTMRHMVSLTCLHTAVYPPPAPQQGETVLCVKCDAYRQVVTETHNYRWHCDTCSAGKHYGSGFVTMETRASSHAVRKIGHHVTLYDGKERLREIYHEPIPLEDAIPF